MDLKKYQKRALKVRKKYKILEMKRDGKEWSAQELAKGFLKDVKDLVRLIKNKENKEKISHEITDCLWSVLVLAHKLNINLNDSFTKNMDEIEEKIDKELKKYDK